VAAKRPYVVIVDSNDRHMDGTGRILYGEYETPDAARAACETIVDFFLLDTHRPGMSAPELYSLFVYFGEDPSILHESRPDPAFSAWEYARRRCVEICR
jgi:hypothetical protein